MTWPSDVPVTVSPRAGARRWGCSVQFLYDRLNSGEIHSVKVGGRRFVSVASADRLFGVTDGGPATDLRPDPSLSASINP